MLELLGFQILVHDYVTSSHHTTYTLTRCLVRLCLYYIAFS